jgi:hypothetical protein
MQDVAFIPRSVRSLLSICGAWIAGSTAKDQKFTPGKDLDIIVPFEQWVVASRIIAQRHPTVQTTSQGGWRFHEDGVDVDVWPDSLQRIFMENVCQVVWNPIKKVVVRMDPSESSKRESNG